MRTEKKEMEIKPSKRLLASFILGIYFSSFSPYILMAREPKNDNKFINASSSDLAENNAKENKTGKEIKQIISSETGGCLELGKARIDIPPEALNTDTEISIIYLNSVEETGESLFNAIPNNGGYRFLPAGIHFEKDVVISLPYDPVLNLKQQSLEDLYTYFYDRNKKQWVRLERIEIDKENCVVKSLTNHFTDMINATLTLPESASPVDVNLNSIKNLEAAKPDSHLIKFNPPQSTNSGDASFSFELGIPSGRKGIQPSLTLNYSSAGGNGILGKGFDLSYGSSITTDTRFGLPNYDTHDTYMLDGVLLVEKERNESKKTIIYSPLKESGFEKIVRYNYGTINDYWEVTAKNGTKRIFENNASSCVGNGNKVFTWNITKTVDVHGNTVVYEYQKDSGYVYPVKISYTGKGNIKGNYSVEFNYEKNTRADIRSEARSREFVYCKWLLKSIETKYKNVRSLRVYSLDYKEGLAKEKMLTSLRIKNGFENDFYEYTFDYEEPKTDTSGNVVYFADPVEWEGGKPLQVGKSTSFGANFNLAAGVGYGTDFIDARITGGGSGSVNSGESYSDDSLIDINGDGKPDSVIQNGKTISVAFNENGKFSDYRDIEIVKGKLTNDLDYEKNSSSSIGWNVYSGVGTKGIPLSLGVSYTEVNQKSSSSTMCSFMDMDRDGLVDIVETGKSTYLKNLDGLRFEERKIFSSVDVDDVVEIMDPKIAEDYRKTYFIQTPFRMWKAPYDGTLSVKEKAYGISGSYEPLEPVITKTFVNNGASNKKLEITVSKDSAKFSENNLSIKNGDRLYFVTDCGDESDKTDIDWNINLQYSKIKGKKSYLKPPLMNLEGYISEFYKTKTIPVDVDKDPGKEAILTGEGSSYGNASVPSKFRAIFSLGADRYENPSENKIIYDVGAKVSNDWRENLSETDKFELVEILEKKNLLLPSVLTSEQFNTYLKSLNKKDINKSNEDFYMEFAQQFEYSITDKLYVIRDFSNYSKLNSFFNAYPMPDSVIKTGLQNYVMNGIVPVYDTKELIYTKSEKKELNGYRGINTMGTMFQNMSDSSKLVNIGKYYENDLLLDLKDGKLKYFVWNEEDLKLKNVDFSYEIIESKNADDKYFLKYGISKDSSSIYESTINIELEGISYKAKNLTMDEMQKIIDDIDIPYQNVRDSYWNLFEPEDESSRVRTDNIDEYFSVVSFSEKEKQDFINCLFREETAYKKVILENPDEQIDSEESEYEETYEIVPDYTYYLLKEEPDYSTAQEILSGYKKRIVLNEKFPFYELKGNEYRLKAYWDKTISESEFDESIRSEVESEIASDNSDPETILSKIQERIQEKYKEYQELKNLLIEKNKKFGFGYLTSISSEQTFLQEHLYEIKNDSFEYLSFNNFTFNYKSNECKKIEWNSDDDYDEENLNIAKEIFNYEEKIETETGLITETRTIEITNQDFLYGGKNNWFYGIWKGNLKGVDNFETMLQDYENQTNDIKTQEDFEAKKPVQKESLSSDDKVTEEETVVHFYLPQLQKENEMVSGISDFMEGSINYDVNLSKALLGTISVNPEVVRTEEGRSTKNMYYMPFIYKSIIHSGRAGGKAFYEIEGLKNTKNEIKNVVAGTPLKMPSIRKSYTDAIDKTPSAQVKLGLISADFSKTTSKEAVQKSFSVSLGGASVGKNTSESTSKQIVQDMNGDGVPDIVQVKDKGLKIIEGNKIDSDGIISFDKERSIENISYISKNSTDTTVYGGSASASGAVFQKVKTTSSGNIKEVQVAVNPSPTASGGVTFTKTDSIQEIGISDINGDGLPDYFRNNQFLFNNGSSFVTAETYFPNLGNLSKNKSESFGMNFALSFGASKSGGLDKANSLTSGVNASIGVTYNSSSSNTEEVMMDINGDGLQDILQMTPGASVVNVKYNTGNGFINGNPIVMPTWNSFIDKYQDAFIGQEKDESFDLKLIGDIPVIGTAVEKGLSEIVINPFGFNAKTYANSLDWNTSVTLGLTGSVGVNINIPIRFFALIVYVGTLNITASAGAGANASTSINGVSVKMMDLDGDGLLDHVLRVPGVGTYWKQNISGVYGQLKQINVPQGGNVQISYKPIYGTPNNPGFKYVMSEVIMNDGCEHGMKPINHGKHSVTTKFDYSDGYYDRQTKESYGFKNVTTMYADGTSKIDTYNQKEYYSKGSLLSTCSLDENGNSLSVSKTTLLKSPYAMPYTEENWIYEESSGKNNYVYTMNKYEYELDYGNCVKVIQNFGDGNSLEALISYDETHKDNYIVSLPDDILVYYNNNITNVIRHRSGSYNSFGELTELKQYYSESGYSVNNLSYDEYGNIIAVTDSRGATLKYEYGNQDNDVEHMFVTKVTQKGFDTDSYISEISYDITTQTKTSETDCNGNTLIYEYDSWQRPLAIRTSYDTGKTPAVTYKYNCVNASGSPYWYAVTNNKVTFDPNDDSVIQTVLQIDGLGRASRSAKTGFVNGKLGWNVSGAVEYDGKGRTVKEGMTDFYEGSIEKLISTPIVMSSFYTEYEYDSKDRQKRTVLPDGNEQTTEFNIRAGKQVVLSIDPLGNKTEQVSDSRGNIVEVSKYDNADTLLTKAIYKYNAISEMITAFDAANNPVNVTYDLLGRKTSLESKDSGRQEFEYDDASNLIYETSSVLREKREGIEYKYDGLNRLIRIVYPETKETVYIYGGKDAPNKAAGKILSVTDASGIITYEYGCLGEVTKESRTINTYLGGAGSKTATMEYVSDYLGRMQSIVYPDDEKIVYGYDAGGQVISVIGEHYNQVFEYVTDILYDEYGQRTKIKYGNGVETDYTYDPARRWLSNIKTENKWNIQFQNIDYKFDPVGNVSSYKNDCLSGVSGNYKTSQRYGYDALYQLVSVEGDTEYNPYNSITPEYTSRYSQTFSFDSKGLGNMMNKLSSEKVSPEKTIGDDLNYNLVYNYDENYAHRLKHVGNRYYKYDSNGNIICEKDGSFDEETVDYGHVINQEAENVYSTDYGWGLTKESDSVNKETVYQRTYTWNEKNQLISSVDSRYSTVYVYGQDGQRSNKYTDSSETVYFNKMWTLHTDSGNARYGGQYAKNIYLGDTRIVTKLNSGDSPSYQEEYYKQYFYHNDHLGSASLISDYKGDEYQRIEYTPYGETWVEKTSNTGTEYLPYKFTGKEIDEETGLYYYGARYLDPKYSLWISTDPALGEYVPKAPINEDAKKYNQNLPGMGGIFNPINGNLYHYAGNNPVRYIDPDGRQDLFYYIKIEGQKNPNGGKTYFSFTVFYSNNKNELNKHRNKEYSRFSLDEKMSVDTSSFKESDELIDKNNHGQTNSLRKVIALSKIDEENLNFDMQNDDTSVKETDRIEIPYDGSPKKTVDTINSYLDSLKTENTKKEENQ